MTTTNMLPELPPELIFSILEYALDENPIQSNLPFLLISKSLYSQIIPIIYHSLQFETRNIVHYDGNREKLIADANPASLLLVRKLKVGNGVCTEVDGAFTPFSNLTHLLLWGTHHLRSPDLQDIRNLHLEELIVWTPTERSELLGLLSAGDTLATTLQRFGSYGAWPREDIEGLISCRSLTHIIFYSGFHSPTRFPINPLRYIMETRSFVCCLLVPGFVETEVTQKHVFSVSFKAFGPLHDPRVVIAKTVQNLFVQTNSTPWFWDSQTTLWKAAEAVIAKNSMEQDITVVECLP
ncbi:hypothetical protein DL96DRAFT_1627459 [Flagelloscypha sp. PMI_526]|nr:hypothetical protein DL96DRAFT_1627459 [Flagelloscypha sp. PMI_526]